MGPRSVIGPAASGGQTPAVAQPQPGAPLPADTVGTTHPHPRRPGSPGSRFALRNWRVRWRLAALIAVPLLTAAVLGALTINSNVSNWQTTGRVQHLAQLNSAVVKYIQAAEDERDYSVASTANRGGFSAKLRTAQRVTDGAAAEVVALADGITVGNGYQLAAVQAANAVQVSAKTLPLVRRTVADPESLMTAIMQVYTVNIIQPANTFTSVVGNETSNTDLRHDVIALGALLQVEDAKSVQRALLLKAVSFPQPTLSPGDVASLQQAHQQEVADLANFYASVDPAEQQNYTSTVSGLPVDKAAQQESLAEALLTGDLPHPLTQEEGRLLATANVNADMSFTVGKVRQVADELTGNISTLANTSRTNASTGLLVTSLVTLLLLLLVLLIFTVVARSLTRPLRKLDRPIGTERARRLRSRTALGASAPWSLSSSSDLSITSVSPCVAAGVGTPSRLRFAESSCWRLLVVQGPSGHHGARRDRRTPSGSPLHAEPCRISRPGTGALCQASDLGKLHRGSTCFAVHPGHIPHDSTCSWLV